MLSLIFCSESRLFIAERCAGLGRRGSWLPGTFVFPSERWSREASIPPARLCAQGLSLGRFGVRGCVRGRGRGRGCCGSWGCGGSGRCCTRSCLGVGSAGGWGSSRTPLSRSMGRGCITRSSSATTRGPRSQTRTKSKAPGKRSWPKQEKSQILGFNLPLSGDSCCPSEGQKSPLPALPRPA